MESRKEQLEDIVFDLLLGENGIPVKIRNKECIEQDYHLLIDTLKELWEYYEGNELISKRLSYALFDVTNCFGQSSKFYTDEEQVNLEDKKDELYELIVDFYEG